MRHAQHACAGAGLADSERAARLEQQLRGRSQQSCLLPLQQPAQAFLPGLPHGFPGDHRRDGRQGKYLRHGRGPGEARGHELCALLYRRHGWCDSRVCGRRLIYQRFAEYVRRRGRGADRGFAEVAALHLRERVRASCGGELLDHGGRRTRSVDPILGIPNALARELSSAAVPAAGRGPPPPPSRGRPRDSRQDAGATEKAHFMAIVAGVDFGTLSVRVSIVDSDRGLLASAIAEYPLHRKREDPDFATQSHEDHMRALAEATRQAVRSAGISGEEVQSIALDTTGSSVIPVGRGLVPLDDYYLWCDHRAKQEAAQITDVAQREKLQAIEWC